MSSRTPDGLAIPSTIPVASTTIEEVFDVVVVGFGIAGGCAALEAARAGARVLLLEKSAVHGGTSSMSGGHFYLGAISRERGEPLLRQYHHIALFFPWFDDAGAFHVAVFESAVETPPEKFVSANSDAWVHLVRVRAPQTGYFWP